MQPTSPPPPPPTLPPRSKCARMARVFSADQNCSGGVNIGELLVNRSALSDTARTSQLHSHFCSSQSCFNQYVNTFRACLVDVSGSRRNVTARKLVRLHAHILSNLCIHLDKFCKFGFCSLLSKRYFTEGSCGVSTHYSTIRIAGCSKCLQNNGALYEEGILCSEGWRVLCHTISRNS